MSSFDALRWADPGMGAPPGPPTWPSRELETEAIAALADELRHRWAGPFGERLRAERRAAAALDAVLEATPPDYRAELSRDLHDQAAAAVRRRQRTTASRPWRRSDWRRRP